MELKDVILSTIAELGEEPQADMEEPKPAPAEERRGESPAHEAEEEKPRNLPPAHAADTEFIIQEREFLQNLRERILVLFEGFQSPNNKRVEAKIDLTLNFLEYLLATLDERIETLKKS
ncbi:CiaD-like domain-containing protein [Hydrogenimonas sp.]